MPKTLKTKMLLGWMTRDYAVSQLDRCVFDEPMSINEKSGLWEMYRDRVTALKGKYVKPAFGKMTLKEKMAVRKFLRNQKQTPSGKRHILDVLKIANPAEMVIRQFFVVTQQSEG